MYARKSLTLAITAGLLFGIGACSMQEKSKEKQEAQAGKDGATLKRERREKFLRIGRSLAA